MFGEIPLFAPTFNAVFLLSLDTYSFWFSGISLIMAHVKVVNGISGTVCFPSMDISHMSWELKYFCTTTKRAFKLVSINFNSNNYYSDQIELLYIGTKKLYNERGVGSIKTFLMRSTFNEKDAQVKTDDERRNQNYYCTYLGKMNDQMC